MSARENVQSGRVSRLAVVAAVFAVGLAAVVPYLSTLQGYFLGEDFGLVQLFSNRPILHFLSLFGRPYDEQIWGYSTDELRAFAAFYYTLGTLGGGSSPLLQHVLNIAFHFLTSLLVLFIARSVARVSWGASVFAAVLFAVMPAHAETISWITGRVDSSMAFFYAASFLAFAHWRKTCAVWLFILSVVAYFIALYSKESAITLLIVLFVHDRLIARRSVSLSLVELRPYLPFALITGAYLALRHFLFINPMHANGLSGAGILFRYWKMQTTYLEMALYGALPIDRDAPPSVLVPLFLVGLSICVFGAIRGARLLPRSNTQSKQDFQLAILFFGPGWWLICTAPLLVAGISPRYMYLPAVGIAISAGLVFDVLWRMQEWYWRQFASAGAAALVLMSIWSLHREVQDWNTAATTSENVQRALEREAIAAPERVLLIVDAPVPGAKGATRLWNYALPFATQAPYMKPEIARRLIVVCPLHNHASDPDWSLWFRDMQRALGQWRTDRTRIPIVVMRWDSRTGELVRRTDVDSPDLPLRVLGLADSRSPEEMAERMNALVNAVQ